MSFWKNIFNGAPSASAAQAVIPLDSLTRSPSTSKSHADGDDVYGRVFFRKDRNIDLYELEELCDAVGWSRRPLRKVRKAIQHSFLVVSMWEQRGQYTKLIGFSRATSDHAFNATIWDVVVHPKFQGRGLG
jgi:aralkylamine N-acetyltransferase